MGQAGAENFTVASALLGRDRRRHLLAIYGFARLVDDTGDEAAGDRGALLDVIDAELSRIYGAQRPSHPVMVTLADTVAACDLPAGPFRRLVQANRWDQSIVQYETVAQLLAYCQLSAAPVGELVLHVFEAATPDRIALADRICAGLQIAEHLQDVAEDHARGRIYIPREDLVRFGCDEKDLVAATTTPARRALTEFQVRRARGLLSSGAPLARTLPPAPRMAVAGFLAGGRQALDELPAAVGGRGRRPRLRRRASFAAMFVRAAMGR